MICIYELTPDEKNHTHKRLVQYFDNARKVLDCLESVNFNFTCYRLDEE